MPLANSLAESRQESLDAVRLPLHIMLCTKCWLSQLGIVVDPHVLYGHYAYLSGVSTTFSEHCRYLAVALKLRLSPSDLVIDIAGNDGTMLSQFREVVGCRVLNIEPAQNVAEHARNRGIPTISEFWSSSTTNHVLDEHGRARVITATNVLAHVDDVRYFIANAFACLHSDGLLVVEVPYISTLLDTNAWDTIYFEHLSYFPLSPLVAIVDDLGGTVLHVEHHDIHGGTMRVFLSPGVMEPNASVHEWLNTESRTLHNTQTYSSWGDTVHDSIVDRRRSILQLHDSGKTIAAFGASAKGNVFLNALGLDDSVIEYIVDDTPTKIGKYSPGTGIEIVSRDILRTRPTDYLLLLAWNFAKEIKDSLPDYKGTWI